MARDLTVALVAPVEFDGRGLKLDPAGPTGLFVGVAPVEFDGRGLKRADPGSGFPGPSVAPVEFDGRGLKLVPSVVLCEEGRLFWRGSMLVKQGVALAEFDARVLR